MGFYQWQPYVSVAQQQAKAKRKIDKLRKQGKNIQPIEIEGRTIARSFWGKAWCDHLESFSDYENRLPRGRRYVRNGSVCHLDIKKGKIEAMVSGSDIYKISIDIKPLKSTLWKSIKKLCAGGIGSMLELLQGKLSDNIMAIVTDQKEGLMPLPKEISLKCSCPDWAVMCKHVSAVMYGIGNRLDTMPELLFTLRGLNADELISDNIAIPIAETATTGDTISDDKLSDIFGIEMDSQIDDHKQDISTLTKKVKKKTKRKSAKSSTSAVKSKQNKSQKKTKKKVKKIAKARKSESTLHALPLLRLTGNTVKKLRTNLKLSVPQFAKRLGVTPTTIYKWEKTRGRLKLQKHSLRAITYLHQENLSANKTV